MSGNLKPLSQTHPDAAGFVLKGEQQAVLCIHGFTATPQTYSTLAHRLHDQTGFSIYAPLLPGHGTYPQDLNQVTFMQWFDFVQKQFADLTQQFDRIHLVGLSLGGALCQWLSQNNANNIASVNLMAPALKIALPRQRPIINAMPILPDAWLKRWTITKKNPPNYVSYPTYSAYSLVQMNKAAKHLKNHLKNTPHPTLIQVPKTDSVVDPKSSSILAKALPNAKLITHETSGHVMVLGKAGQLVQQNVIDFIQHNRD